MSTQSFIKAFKRATKRIPSQEDHRSWKDQVAIELHPDEVRPDTIHLSDIFTLNADEKGNGSRGIEYLKKLADRHRVSIVADVVSGNPAFTDEETVEWYVARGFIRDEVIEVDTEETPYVQKVRYEPR